MRVRPPSWVMVLVALLAVGALTWQVVNLITSKHDAVTSGQSAAASAGQAKSLADQVAAACVRGDGSVPAALCQHASDVQANPQPGPAGEPGPQGLQGIAGALGLQGPQGEQGLIGPAGPPGATGAQGIAGIDGAIGPSGPAGQPGTTGTAGSDGQPGPAGPAGAQGAKGDTGDPGTPGAAGPYPTSAAFVADSAVLPTICMYVVTYSDGRQISAPAPLSMCSTGP